MYQVGTVLRISLEGSRPFRPVSNSYWKITGKKGPRAGGAHGFSYPCIKCSKNGKEYKEINGFESNFLETDGISRGEVIVVSLT
jgi:hypothetical protein